MTETLEFNATTVEEALNKAAESLGIDEAELSYEVVDAGSAGFLGMGSRDARIVVNKTNTADAPAEDGEDQPQTTTIRRDSDSVEPAIPRSETPTTSQTSEEYVAATQEQLDRVEEFIRAATEAIGFDARIDVYDTDEFVAVDVTTGETGLFIGQKGETIDALQYLLNVAIYKDGPSAKRAIIDAEGYRQRRMEAVQGMAHRMARKALREHRLVELPPMNTAERRIVHLFLKDNNKVTTESKGHGENRRVTVSPIQ